MSNNNRKSERALLRKFELLRDSVEFSPLEEEIINEFGAVASNAFHHRSILQKKQGLLFWYYPEIGKEIDKIYNETYFGVKEEDIYESNI